jgi:hypothetical protein
MNKRIIEYFTAVDSDPKSLDKQVGSFVQEGYQPYGSPYIIPGEKVQICQAIVMYEDPDDWKLSSKNPL